MSSGYEVFVSYAPEDDCWVQTFVRRLRDEGLRVAYDRLVGGPDDPVRHSLEQTILATAASIVVCSRASAASPWVHEEYGVLMRRAAEDGRAFVPVGIEDIAPPGFLTGTPLLDFGIDDYDALINLLVSALRR
ncbi:hypothetical protein DPM19_26225 [Actinomadura craniellae]|uniref:TIR domain-containing protein n=1 Tax=Actinomadura craniellae TaxID=2231787 RepID=A0A365GZG6_9ACTN|nr:toll/interleukin-1 receptor domain-containing protein [Actinomadura craniellae]RAY12220.1 hypothetical protein DPM19_26225 [Actinomadura craniellae]